MSRLVRASVTAGEFTPVLITVPDVELIEVGEDWATSTGLFTWEPEDLLSGIASQEDPAVRTPVIKLGHIDPRFNGNDDGQPAFGRVGNLRVVNNGQTLAGDLLGVPKWLADVMPTAYPRRSIEGYFRQKTRTGNEWPFILTALALLGAYYPAINTLEDLPLLWGAEPPELTVPAEEESELEVAASAGNLIRARRVTPVAKLKDGKVPGTKEVNASEGPKASVTTSDIQREWYANSDAGQCWWWIRQVLVNPLQLVVDDDEGGLYLIDVTVGSDDEITYGEPQSVKVEYVAATASGLVEVHKDGQIVVASFEEATASGGKVKEAKAGGTPSKGTPKDKRLKENKAKVTKASAPADADDDDEEEDGVKLTPDALKRLGLAEDASDEQVNEAIMALAEQEISAGGDDDGDDAEEQPAATPDPATTTPAETQQPAGDQPAAPTPTTGQVTIPDGMVLVDQAQWATVQTEVAASASDRKKRAATDRDNFISAACQAGKFPRARIDHYKTLWNADPAGTKVLIDTLAPGLVPVEERGQQGDTDPAVAAAGQQAYPEEWKSDRRVAAQRQSVNTRVKVVND